MTSKQIQKARNISKQAVSKVICNLKKKGFLNPSFRPNFPKETMVDQSGIPLQKVNQKVNHFIRLHRQEFNIRILYQDEKYQRLLGKGRIFKLDGNTIRLYNKSVEVYSGHDFIGRNTQEATSKSMEYFMKFFHRLENELKVLLVKERSQNIRIVNQHYAETNNEFAEDSNKRKDKLQIRGEDGKTWLLVDNSLKLNELETVHPSLAKEDMQEVVKPFFDDLRVNKPPVLSEIMRVLGEAVEVNKETAAGLNSVVQLLKPKELKEEVHLGKRPSYIG